MQYHSSESKPTKKKKIIRSLWFWILIGLVIVATLFFIMLPVGIDYGIESYLIDQGVDQATLEDVDFNPITGRMTLTNLNVTTGAQTVLKIPEATFKIKWTPFIRKRFVLERFTISDTELIVEELENGNWQIGGIIMPGKKKSTEPSSWNFSFQEATAKNCKIKFISARLTSDLTIEQAKISKLTSWLQEDNARLEFSGQLNDARMQLQLDVSPFGSEIVAAGRIKLKGLTLNPFSQLLQPHLKKLEGRLDIDVSIETRQTADGAFNHHQKGPVKLHQIRAHIADMNLAKDDLAWDGAIRVDIPKSEESLKISADGRLNGTKLTLGIENENLKMQQDNLSWKGKIDYAKDKTNQKINTDGQISLVDLKMESPALNLAEEKLTWKGALQFSSTAKTEDQKIIADGTLDGNHLQVSLPGRKLKFEHQGLSWKGRLDSGETTDFSALKVEADVILNDIQILNSETNQPLLNTKRFELKAINVESLNKINVSNIIFKGLALLADLKSTQSPAADPTPLRIQEVKLKDVRLSQQNNLAIDAIHLKALQAYVHRDSQGKLSTIDRWNTIQGDVFSANQTQQTASDTKAEERSAKFGIRIGQFDIAGESGLRFKDESVTPEFGIDLSILEVRLTNLDNSRPEQPASVKLLVSDKKNARLSLEGSMQPFAEQLSLDWIGKIEALELPPLSPYVIQNTGYRFVSGEMQADVPVKINQNQLDGKIDLILYNPTVERVEAKKSPEENQGKIQISMSLDSALKLLRDDHKNVKLNIPVSGDINDPKFSVADAINSVLAQTLQTSALSYLKFMLGPYGIGLAVAEQAIKSTSKIRLNPILFEPGSTELGESAIDYLKRVSAILKEHPAAQVDVCGVATESDRAALSASPSTKAGAQATAQKGNIADKDKTITQKEPAASTITDAALLNLAKNRIERIEDQLIKLHGIAAKRIIACKPKVDSGAEAKPRVDLEI